MKHKHAELIKAWADGAQIQWKDCHGDWNDCMSYGNNRPAWHPEDEYRIKPEETSERIMYIYNNRQDGKTWISPFKYQEGYENEGCMYMGSIKVMR